MIGMGTKQTTTTPDYSNVMSDFAVTVFGIMLAGMALYMVGAIVALTVFLVRNWGN
jgi:hypothetical protein